MFAARWSNHITAFKSVQVYQLRSKSSLHGMHKKMAGRASGNFPLGEDAASLSTVLRSFTVSHVKLAYRLVLNILPGIFKRLIKVRTKSVKHSKSSVETR